MRHELSAEESALLADLGVASIALHEQARALIRHSASTIEVAEDLRRIADRVSRLTGAVERWIRDRAATAVETATAA